MSAQIVPSDAAIGLVGLLLLGVLAAVLTYQLFALVLDAFRRGFGVVDRDTSFRVTALARELAATEDRLADTERRADRAEHRLAEADRVIAELRARSRAQDADLHRALDQVRRLNRPAVTAAAPPAPAPAEPVESAPRAADPTPVLADLFDRVLPGLVADEATITRQTIAAHLTQRTGHLHRVALPYEEITLVLRSLDAERVECFVRDLDRVVRQLSVPAVGAVVADHWLEQPERTEQLRRLRVTTGVEPALEPALVTLVGRYSVRELRRFAQRLRQVRELAAAPTVAEVATERSAALVTTIWHELAGSAPLRVEIRPDLIGGLVLRGDLTYQDRSWARAVLRPRAHDEGDTDDRAA